MAYSYTIYHSIDQVDLDQWRSLELTAADTLLDPRFLRVVERSMADRAECRYVIMRNELKVPVGIACLCSSRLDLTLLVTGRARRALNAMARLLPYLKGIPLQSVGCPLPTGHAFLRMADDADPREILGLLDSVLGRMAAQYQSRILMLGEFDDQESSRLDALEELGYQRVAREPMNQMQGGFCDFDDFCASLGSRKRYPISRSRKKFAESGLSVAHVRGADGAGRLDFDAIHGLFRAVVEDKPRSEEVPASFFRELALGMPEESVFTLIHDDQRLVACATSLIVEGTFHQLFVGYDRPLNPGCDLYFNLFFEAVDYALRQGATTIYLGQTSSTFKMQKLDAFQIPRYLYVKSLRRLGSAIVRRLAVRGAVIQAPGRKNERSRRQELLARKS